MFLVCEDNLAWSPIPPECVPVTCGQIPKLDNSIIESTGQQYRDKVNYSCMEGYEIRVCIYNFHSFKLKLFYFMPFL